MIDKPIIEALASLGTGNTPRFQWCANALTLKDAIDGLAINRMRLPGQCEENEVDPVLALAMGLHYTKVNTTRSDLPDKAMRRVATLSMHFGAMLADVAHIHDQKIAALLVHALAGNVVTNVKPSMQNLLVAASCASKLPPGRFPSVEAACRSLLVSAGVNQQILEMVGSVMDSVQTAEVTRDYAFIASQLFPDVGGKCSDEPDDDSENGEGELPDEPSENSPQSSGEQSSGDSQATGPDGVGPGHVQGVTSEPRAEASACDQTSVNEEGGPSSVDPIPNSEGEPAPAIPGTADTDNDNHSQEESEKDELQVLDVWTSNTPEPTEHSQGTDAVAGGIGDASRSQNLVRDTSEIFAQNQNLVSEIMRLLQSMDKRNTTLERQGRRISTTHVWRLKKLGDTKIFKHTTKVVGSQIAVEILVDGSASMRDDLKVACEVSLSFCDALQRLPKSSSAVSIFSGDQGVSKVVKEHTESVHKVRSKLSFVTAEGGTPTGPAIFNRIKPLLAQRQARKLMVVITDGKARDMQVANAAVQYANANGVEIIGIGIGKQGNAVKRFIPGALTINSLAELQGAMRKLLQNQVLA